MTTGEPNDGGSGRAGGPPSPPRIAIIVLNHNRPGLTDALAGCEVLEVREGWQPGHPGLFGPGRKR